MRKIRILYITNGDGVSGASVALMNLISELRDEIECEVVFPHKIGNFSPKLEKMGIKCHHLRYTFCNWPNIKGGMLQYIKYGLYWMYINTVAPYKLLSIIKNFEPDIIHSNVGPINIGYAAARMANIPHVWHLREYIDKDFAMHPFPTFSSQVKKYHNKINHCIAITDGVYEHFKLSGDDVRIYDGVLPDKATIVKPKKNYFLFVGRILDGKGAYSLLDAYNQYIECGGLSELWYAGDGSEYDKRRIRHFVEKYKITDKVKLLGYRDDVYNLMSEAKALFVPSRFEGFGFITTEAMYNHCLVVGRDTAGTKEQFDNGLQKCGKEIGIRFEKDEEMPAIMHDIDNQDYSDMIQRAYDVVTSLYTIKENAKNVLNYYKHVLQQ